MTNLGLQIGLHVVYLSRFSAPIAVFACRLKSELVYLLGIPIKLRSSTSFSRIGTSMPVRVGSDEQTAEISTYYFLRNHTLTNLVPNEYQTCENYLIGKLPSASSGLYIWKIWPNGDIVNGLVHCEGSLCIHFRDHSMDGFAVDIRGGESQVYHESAVVQSEQQLSDPPSISISEPRRVDGIGWVRLVDIKDPEIITPLVMGKYKGSTFIGPYLKY